MCVHIIVILCCSDLTASFGGFNRTKGDFAQTIKIAEIITVSSDHTNHT